MATQTTNTQRIGIWIIAIVMTLGTIGSFLVVILSNQNQTKQQNQATNLAAQQAAAHAASSDALKGYESFNKPFDASSVKTLSVQTLVQGTGTPAKASSTLSVSYFGWTSDGKIFDSTNQSGKNTPISLSLANVIQGWTQGLTGVPAGSTVELTIPADLAYGTTAGVGQPSGPLKFIVEVESVS